MKKLLAAVRLVLFAAFGVVIASAVFFVLGVLINANYTAGTSFIEDWIVSATCDEYELSGTVRDTTGKPVPFAIVEAAYYGSTLTTRSNSDGTFLIQAAEAVCDQRPPERVGVLVIAEDFRPKRHSVPFEQSILEVSLDARDFRP
jgi:hypothetical protein